MNPQVYATMKKVRDCEDDAVAADLRARSTKSLGTHFAAAQNHADLEELAFALLNLGWSDAMGASVVNQVIEVKTVGLGDPDYVNEDLRGMRAYWQGKGGQILSDVIRYERATMPKEEQVAAIDMHQDELALDFWGQFDNLVAQAREKLSQLPVTRLLELLQSGVNASPYYGTFAASTLSSTDVDPIIEAVASRSKGNVTILGSREAIRKFSVVGLDYGPNIQEKILATGQIATYKGYAVTQFENFEDFSGNLVLPLDEIYVVGQNSGRLTFYGAQAKVAVLRMSAFRLRWETARDAGMLLYGASKGRIGRMILT